MTKKTKQKKTISHAWIPPTVHQAAGLQEKCPRPLGHHVLYIYQCNLPLST